MGRTHTRRPGADPAAAERLRPRGCAVKQGRSRRVRCLLRPQGKVEDKEEARLHLKAEGEGVPHRLLVVGAEELEADGDRIRR